MATTKTPSKKPSTKTRKPAAAKASRRRTPAATTHVAAGPRLKALPGRSKAGQAVTPSAVVLTRAPQVELRKSRPYTSRYPIPDADFVALKEGAPRAKLAKVKATQVADKGGKDVEPQPRAMVSPELGPMARAMVSPELGPEMRAMVSPELLPGMAPGLAPNASASFEGIAATGWLPPDCTLATGPDHVLVSVNSSVAIHAKTGGAPLLSQTLTAWFANVAQGLTIFDPKALYDQHAGRWILLAVAFTENPNKSVFLLSCSNGPDPMGGWRNYSLDAMLDGATSTNNWADYPGLGVDHQAIYLTANMFAFNGGFQYAKLRVVPKAGPYGGGAATFFDFVRLKNPDGTLAFTVTPCHTFGAPQVEYLVNSAFPSGNQLTLWQVSFTAGQPAVTRSAVAVSRYSLPPNAQQKGGGTAINTGDVRVLHAVFRGDSVWTALTTAHTWGSGGNKAAVHWFQIRGANATLVQEGVYGSASKHYYYPAPCPDNNGNMLMVFSRSGTTEYAQIRYTGRVSTDPLGALQTSRLLKAGTANYKALDGGGRNRWGDYAGVAADPSNSRVVWFYSMYAVAGNQWATRVGSALF